MSEQPTDFEIQATRQARDLLIAVSKRHEAEAHAGEPCPENRLGLAAFICHALGVTARNLPDLELLLDDYGRLHAERQHRHDGRHNGHHH